MPLNFFKDLFKKKETSFVGIDIGSSSIKVVQLRKRYNKAVLETYGEIALGAYDGKEVGRATNLSPDKIALALTDIMTEAKVSSKAAGMSIPFISSLISLIEVPEADQKQLTQMVPLEARKYIPVPISEVFLDWSIIPKEVMPAESAVRNSVTPATVGPQGLAQRPTKTLNKLDVMIVAIHNDTINKFQTINNQAALNTGFYEIEMFSSIRSLLDQNLTPVMIMDVGAGSTKLYIVEQGIIRTSHLVRRGSQDISLAMSQSMGIPFRDAEKIKTSIDISSKDADPKAVSIINLSLDYIFSEANQLIVSYEKKYNKNISQVILIGGGVLLKGFLQSARKNFQIEVVLGEPFAKVEYQPFLEEILKTTNPEFSVAVGLALRMLQEQG